MQVGEIGWGLNLLNDKKRLKSGHQIKVSPILGSFCFDFGFLC